MEQNRPTDMEAVRSRLQRLLDKRGWSARELAFLTGDDEKNVQRWVYGKTKTIPADFVGRCEAKRFAAASYLLRGDGPEAPVPTGVEAYGFRRIAKIVDQVRGVPTAEVEVKLEAARTSERDADESPKPPTQEGQEPKEKAE